MFLDVKAQNLSPGIPDSRTLKTKISRGSGTGHISFGYAVVVLLGFTLFAFLVGLILLYKRKKGIRNDEKKLFLTTY